MSDFERAFSRLAALTNYEKLPPQRPYRFDLAGMERLCLDLGDPQFRLGDVAQVAGSKGKGTVTHLLAAMGVAAGKRVAAYTSPHVRHVLERVLWQGRPVAEEEFAPSLVRATDAMREGQTWFEVFTAAAIDHFARRDPEWTVLEVGLGGRLDSTTVVPKKACAITTIELEHTQVLGDDEVAIAREKAGILRPGVPCVTMTTGEALAVIAKRARTMGVPLRIAGRDFGHELHELDVRGLDVTFWSHGGASRRLRLPLHGIVQAQAFGLARELFRLLDPAAEERLFASDDFDWVRSALPPARFQVLDADRPIVVDGAHTERSLSSLAADLAATFPGRRFALVFGVASGKRWERGLGRVLALTDRAFVAPLVGKASEAGETVRDCCERHGVPCRLLPSIREAVRHAQAEAADLGLVVTGSLYVAGEALEVLQPGG